jgi:hypothetical protein
VTVWLAELTVRPLALKVPRTLSSTSMRTGLPLWSRKTWNLPVPTVVVLTVKPHAAVAPSSTPLSSKANVPIYGAVAAAGLPFSGGTCLIGERALPGVTVGRSVRLGSHIRYGQRERGVG